MAITLPITLLLTLAVTTDGHNAYLDAVSEAFENHVDYSMLVKIYGQSGGTSKAERKYSPPICLGAKKKRVIGNPNMGHVNTSYVESHNQKMRQHMRRFTRLTAAHSKKLANHLYALALYFAFYNFIKQHSTLRMSPAMAAGVTDHLWEMSDIVALIDEANPPKKRGPYKKAVECA